METVLTHQTNYAEIALQIVYRVQIFLTVHNVQIQWCCLLISNLIILI